MVYVKYVLKHKVGDLSLICLLFLCFIQEFCHNFHHLVFIILRASHHSFNKSRVRVRVRVYIILNFRCPTYSAYPTLIFTQVRDKNALKGRRAHSPRQCEATPWEKLVCEQKRPVRAKAKTESIALV